MVLCAALLATGLVAAQTYPSKPVRILLGTPAGGPPDVMARGTAQVLSERLGQPFIVENRVGADSMIAGEACARAAPDGHVLCVSNSLAVALNPAIRVKMPYDPLRDLAPVIHYGYAVNALLVHPSVPANTLQELFALAKARPGSISWGSYGVASPSHLYVEWLNNVKGINFLNVPYKAASLAYPAMLAGQIDVVNFNLGQALPVVKAGKAKALAVVLPKRSSLLPEVPTHTEGGLDIGVITTFGLYAPTGTPRDIINRLNAELANGIFKSADLRQRYLINQGLEIQSPAGESPEAFAAYLKREFENFSNLVKLAKIKPE
jgi:tripartite-type tricarboxylate transporter receptor subunit TctC